MEFRLLGPVEVVSSGKTFAVGPPQRCAVLAALAVDAGRQVTVETLITRVWSDRPPERARRALQAHVTRLRRVLEQAGAHGGTIAPLVRRSGGYLLGVEPERVDVHRFRLRFRQAREARRPEPERVRLLREALELWQGEALGGLTGSWVERTRQDWRREHLDAVLSWAGAELRAGDAAAVIGPLTEAARQNPFLEPLVAALMRALYVVGRSSEALDLYTATRGRLVDELGAEPGAELRRVHQGILRDDLDTNPGPVPVRTSPASAVVPAQLPSDVRGFCGRGDELARLDALVRRSREQPTAVVISALTGTAGVGKTALAVHWAHRVRDRFPDGQLYVNLRGFAPEGSAMDPAEAVRGFLDALHVAPRRVPADVAAQAALYRTLLADRRMLIVLDNARDSEQTGPLLPGTAGCVVVVTSRNQLSGLVAAGSVPLTLDVLAPEEARELLTRRLGADRVEAEPEAVAEIVRRCDRLPLALAIVAARAATHPGFPLRALAAELRAAHSRLDALTGGESATDVRAVFSWSYRTLTPDAARLFRLLGLHHGPDISVQAAASLAALPVHQVRPLLAELARTHMLVEHVPGRYAFHDLLRAYAAEKAHGTDTAERRREAVRRALDHYLRTGHTAAMILHACRDPITLPEPAPGVVPEVLLDLEQALRWYTAEHAVLMAAVDHAVSAGFDTHTWQLAWTLTDFLDRRGHWHDWITTQRAAVTAGRRSGEPATEAGGHQQTGHAYLQLGRFAEAGTHLERALALYRQAGELPGQGQTHYSFAVLLGRQDRHREALEHARRCLELFRAAAHPHGQALALNTVGWLHAELDDHQEALAHCGQALTLFQEIGDRHGQGESWDRLGYAHHHLGHHAEAVACYKNALEHLRRLGDRYWEAGVLTHLGDTHEAAGDISAARAAWRSARDILDDLDHPGAVEVRARLGAEA
ncbi:BTAD domain-containing putative transcriptional regulator [Sphaerisporangium sp. TRM90804]|uniref:AfsR/SARP family transcriptional regulator n=1 Tax=Sphaerisporangium sp. TRM90804 TaxID=3031113 RepID=UPI00244B588F|nr:BTAD domain-containing putative transcriptional regulator [Sphaerisporangium sp. TRM90804]MDH2423990.1 BTAD domain-containing putative transcriptional regulator [Sphaerisporangium sp. TRM90804]